MIALSTCMIVAAIVSAVTQHKPASTTELADSGGPGSLRRVAADVTGGKGRTSVLEGENIGMHIPESPHIFCFVTAHWEARLFTVLRERAVLLRPTAGSV